MDVYEKCPELKNDRLMIRMVEKKDCADLLKVYNDPLAVPLFNSDNCNGDDFHYQTMERMMQAIDFWIFSYNHRYFVRWSIIDRQTGEAIGTVELFQRKALDGTSMTGLLRLDLRSDYERADALENLLNMIMEPACEWFDCTSITTKAVPKAEIRRTVLTGLGFIQSAVPLLGNDGTCYDDYFVCCKRA